MRTQKEDRCPDEFGDFQTPLPLAADVCRFLSRRGIAPASIVEPTCGLGNFVLSALEAFPTADLLGVEINPTCVEKLTAVLRGREQGSRARVLQQSVFDLDWRAKFRALAEPVLVLGNPPWVTNAQLGVLGSTNLPHKSNFQGHAGLDALTGKSNFDVSEWMLIRLLEALDGLRGWLAMLCKTGVARKALLHTWKSGIAVDWAEMRAIDASAFFGVAVDACLLVCSLSPRGGSRDCGFYPDFMAGNPTSAIGWYDGQLIADVRHYLRWKHLAGEGPYQWRSGVKHDCSKVMELLKEGGGYRNGLGELVELEEDYVYPMLKSSDLANGPSDEPVRWMLVPQRAVGDDTREIERRAPKTWSYLLEHGEALDRRGSSIYRNRPRFSVFGVGDYTFAPWKVAISGFYKRLKFAVVGISGGRPNVLDDTCYFVACQSEQEARCVASLLNSDVSREFFCAFVFWDAKRPITVELLRRLNLLALAREMGAEDQLVRLPGKKPKAKLAQLNLFSTKQDT
jgi:hypothetical protein